MKTEVLYEDNHLLVLFKPAGVLSQGDQTGDPTILDWARAYLKEKYQKPGNIYVATVHRLDRPVSGVFVLARTSKAAERLTRQFREREVRKYYWAVVEGQPAEPEGVLRHRLSKLEEQNLVRAVRVSDEGKDAELSFRLLEAAEGWSRLQVEPKTGRSHQIRVQLAESGLPIVGDTKYGSRFRIPDRSIGLQSAGIEFRHPTREELLSFSLPERLTRSLEELRQAAASQRSAPSDRR